jgi:SpoVK/Ycf46/Vps4 family AAA+-type ATPase
MKANGGIFHVDDFGRQAIPPRQILNRLIVPLESGVDYLNVARAGTTVSVPYAAVLLLSTNLEPGDLVDEAFLRRVRYKALVPDPTFEEFRSIFQRVCQNHTIGYSEQALRYLLSTHYEPVGRPLRGCHPRDIVEQLIATARYLGIKPELTPELIDRVARAYFSDIRPGNWKQLGEGARTIS